MIFGFYNRNFDLNEDIDFNENVNPILIRNKITEAIPQYYDNNIIGWIIKSRYE